ncbi:MAG: YkgJ family cysteine cluster protein [Desulfovibrionales bacterium]|nr:YkgJ family cysteine cluster protein [Desulfovibrionales bacterium]
MSITVFDCQMCGHCCHGQGGIVVSAPERQRLAEYLGLSEEDFCATYTQTQDKKLVLRSRGDGFCIFFDAVTACTVHPAKPDVCRAWPFFRGNLVDAVSWEMAQDYCPGIRPDTGHAEFARQGRAYLIENKLTKNGREDEANALHLPGLTDKD